MMIFGAACRRRVATQMTTENVPQVMKEISKVVRLIPQERDQQCTVYQIVYMPVLQIHEQIVAGVKVIPLVLFPEQTKKQIVEFPNHK